jgi:hypothetical protein
MSRRLAKPIGRPEPRVGPCLDCGRPTILAVCWAGSTPQSRGSLLPDTMPERPTVDRRRNGSRSLVLNPGD